MKIKVYDNNNKHILTVNNLEYADQYHSMLCNEGIYISKETINQAIKENKKLIEVYMNMMH